MSLYATNRSNGSGGGGGVPIYPDFPSFPGSATQGDLAVAADTGILYEYDGAVWQPIASNIAYENALDAPTSIGALDSQPANADGLALVANVLSTQSADATHPGMVNNTIQVLSGSKTFSSLLNADGGIDISAPGTLTIGATNADIINIGNAGATVNIQGDTIYENTPILLVADPLITVNHGGGVGSGQNAGIEVEEAGSITGYAETSADRNSWILKAPNTAGIATITPGVSGITLNQSSHNPVTIGTANGLSLATQVLSLALSDTATTGALSATDWNTFNNKQPAGNYITALTGDGTAAGPGSVAFTLATVNGDVGSFGTASSVGSFTVNGKGLITAASNTSILISEAQVTNLVTDLAGKQPVGNYITALTGDVVATGPGSVAATIQPLAVTNAKIANATIDLTTKVTGALPIANGGTGQITATAAFNALSPITTTGDLIIGNGANSATRLGIGSNTFVLTSNGTTASWAAPAAYTPIAPKITTYLSGAGTFNTTGTPLYIRVRAIGGGGGGSGAGVSGATNGTSGGNTTFGTTLIAANGGAGGAFTAAMGALGGTYSLGTAVGVGMNGSAGMVGEGTGLSGVRMNGGFGGTAAFGGGAAVNDYLTGGSAGGTNSGAGGSGGGNAATSGSIPGSGGGAGAFVDAVIYGPLLSSYGYNVGAAGGAGSPGVSGFGGGVGSLGYLEVTEFYQ